MQNSKLTINDYKKYYEVLLFRNGTTVIEKAVNRAYRDVCRTIFGFANCNAREKIKNNCKKIIINSINKLLEYDSMSQEKFDKWHKSICEELIKEFKNQLFTYGQAQKWINMTLKYISILDYDIVKGIYEYCHVPIDNIIINQVEYNFFNKAWSKINSYEEYYKFQKWFKKECGGIPLDEEFKLYINSDN